jgi:hypothetical protein
MSVQELDEEFEDVNFDEIDAGVKKLLSLGVIVQRDDKRFILSVPGEPVSNLAGTIQALLRYAGSTGLKPQELESKMTASLDDIRMTLKQLEKRKVVTRLMGQRWRLTTPVDPDDEEDEDIAATQRYLDDITTTETKEDGSFEIDRKTLQKGFKDAVDKMEINQKRWAACMRTSNPTLASQIMDMIAVEPRGLTELCDSTHITTTGEELEKILMELKGLAQIEKIRSTWHLVDKSAKVDKIRQDLHRLVDELWNLARST